MSKNQKAPVLPGDLLPLNGSIMPVQNPKGTQEYPTSGVKRATVDGKHMTHCPFEGKWIDGDPIVDPPEGPRITNKDGATTYTCPSCGKCLATIGNSMYNTGIGQNAQQNSNTGRVAARRSQ